MKFNQKNVILVCAAAFLVEALIRIFTDGSLYLLGMIATGLGYMGFPIIMAFLVMGGYRLFRAKFSWDDYFQTFVIVWIIVIIARIINLSNIEESALNYINILL